MSIADKLKEYLGFRHFFVHSFALYLHPSRIESLIEKIHSITDEKQQKKIQNQLVEGKLSLLHCVLG